MALENYEASLDTGFGRYIKAMAASDVLDGWFFALDIKPGASRAEVERAFRDRDEGVTGDAPTSEAIAARAGYQVLMGSCWGRA